MYLTLSTNKYKKEEKKRCKLIHDRVWRMDDNVKMILSHKMTIEQVKGIASPPQTFEWIPA